MGENITKRERESEKKGEKHDLKVKNENCTKLVSKRHSKSTDSHYKQIE